MLKQHCETTSFIFGLNYLNMAGTIDSMGDSDEKQERHVMCSSTFERGNHWMRFSSFVQRAVVQYSAVRYILVCTGISVSRSYYATTYVLLLVVPMVLSSNGSRYSRSEGRRVLAWSWSGVRTELWQSQHKYTIQSSC